MPLQMGHSKEVIAKNIKEMIAAGHDPKKAIASALEHADKSRKMATGGMVEPEDENDETRSLAAINELGAYEPSAVENPEMEEHSNELAKALSMKEDAEEVMPFAEGGMVKEPGGLSSMQVKAIEDAKKKRTAKLRMS